MTADDKIPSRDLLFTDVQRSLSTNVPNKQAQESQEDHSYSAGSTGLLDFGVIKVVLNSESSIANKTLRKRRGGRGNSAKSNFSSNSETLKKRKLIPKVEPENESTPTSDGSTALAARPDNQPIPTHDVTSNGKFPVILPKPLPVESSAITPTDPSAPVESRSPLRRSKRTSASARTYHKEDPPDESAKQVQIKVFVGRLPPKPKQQGLPLLLPKPDADGKIHLPPPPKPDPPPTIYKCQICSEEFKVKLEYSNHLDDHDKLFWESVEQEAPEIRPAENVDMNDPCQCKICGIKFVTKARVTAHVRRCHKNKNVTYRCKLCDRKVSSKSAMHNHLIGHSVSKKFKCEYCDKTFQYKSVFRTHIKLHTKESAQLCQECGKIFSSGESLRMHVNSVHLKNVEKKFSCEICGKKFITKSKLKFHRSSHLANRDHLCEICGKTFKHKTLLNSHKKTHALTKCKSSKEKLHFCTVCPKRFGSLSTLADHVTVSHEKECILCGAAITSWQMLRDHKPVCNQIVGEASIKPELHTNKVGTIVPVGTVVPNTSSVEDEERGVQVISDTTTIDTSGLGTLSSICGESSSIMPPVGNVAPVQSQENETSVTEDAVETLLLALAQGGSAISSEHLA